MSSAATDGPPRLTFERMQMQVDVTFWMELRQRKLTEWRLSEDAVPLRGELAAILPPGRGNGNDGADDSGSLSGGDAVYPANDLVVFSRASLCGRQVDESGEAPRFLRPTVPGELKNFNLAGDLTSADPRAALYAVLRQRLLEPLVFAAAPIADGEDDSAEDREAAAWRAAPFLFLLMYTHVDAKNYVFYHREAFPVMAVDSPVVVRRQSAVPRAVADAMRDHCMARAALHGADTVFSLYLCVLKDSGEEGAFTEFSPRRYARLTAARPAGEVLICFYDAPSPGGGAEGDDGRGPTIGWPMRNALLCLRLVMPALTAVALAAVRVATTPGAPALVRRLDCECAPLDPATAALLAADPLPSPSSQLLRLTGWRKAAAETVRLGPQLDPASLANSGSRLNLELMKWRQLPDLDLDGLAGCRALLLGAGTLGCNVARGLLMWGVRHLTLVDRGTVHYSNLARQSLFVAADAAGGGKKKAEAAADALRAIIPGAAAEGVAMTIHMPGHRTDPDRADETRAEIDRLAELVRAHDVVFLLTDSWESRWLPTVLAAAHGTPVINVALGFDTYVVMRHGMPGSSVRCYFCSDVSAPTDSLTARALDQQCTVTRPGVSGVASALAVELLAALYQLDPPLGSGGGGGGPDRDRSRLGAVPQQIRGSVSSHATQLLSGERNPHCTACSAGVCAAYRDGGSEFLLRCINDPAHIEAASGLAATRAEWAAHDDADWSFDSASDEGQDDHASC